MDRDARERTGVMLGDLRHACRSIARMPVLSAVVVFSVAAGIGINTVVFSWIQARILDPIPGVADGAAVLLIEPRSDAGLYTGASWPEYQDMREQLHGFADVFAGRMAPLYVGEAGAVERLFGLLVSDNYFSALGVQPAMGRFFRPEEAHQPGRDPVAVISHRTWRTRFQGDPAILSRTVRVNGQPLQVIGVTPDVFQGTTPGLQVDVWLPATLWLTGGARAAESRGGRGFGVMGRLAPGVSRPQAQTEIDAFMRQLAQAYPATNTNLSAEVLPFHMSPRGPQRMLNAALAVLQAVMLLLLLAVCGNVANLMLARGSARQREMATRLALGARPRRIASLLLTESVLLALAGAALGAALAVWGTRGLLILPLTGIPIRFQTGIDLTALAFAMGLGTISGLVFGVAPALQLARLNPHAALRAGATAAGRSALRHGLMAAQVALAVMVLIVAGLFVRAFLETRYTSTGFTRDGLVLAAYDLSGREADAAFSRNLARRAIDRIAALPLVEAVAIGASVPLDIHGLPSRVFTVDGRARTDGGFDEALANTVTRGYFDVMNIRLTAGRDFSPLGDTAAIGREAVVNEAFVRRYLPGLEPIGRRLQSRGGAYTIVGVVQTSLYNAFGEPPTPIIYFSYRDVPQPRGELHVRLASGGAAFSPAAIGQAMREVDADLPVFNLRTMSEHIDANLIFRRIPARMFAVLGPLLLLLAAIGIYAVVAYAVSLRTREIGVRLALGATAGRVVRGLVAETVGLAALGASVGWAIAFAAALLVPPGRPAPVVFVAVPAILLGVAAAASWLPAGRAATQDPLAALRTD
jgi:predicted permease